MSAIIGGPAEPTFSDAEISELIEQESEVILTAVKMKIEKQRPGGAFFSFLNKAIYGLSKYGILNRLIKIIITTIVLSCSTSRRLIRYQITGININIKEPNYSLMRFI